jgi:glycosyltransferase involved in cell wall biosynthesis
VSGEGAFHFVHPGPISQMSGGTLYDLRVIDELRQSGWRIDLHELPGRFPLTDEETKGAANALLAEIPSGETVVFDGLALPAFVETLSREAERLALMALVHHPTADETGLTTDESRQLFEVEKQVFAALRRIVVPSPAMGRRLAVYGVETARIDVAEPGVEPAARAVGSGGDVAALLCVASLTPRKGHLVLLDALSDCRDLDWHLICAGPLDSDPDTTAAITDAIDRLGLSDRVRLVGSQVGKDLDALYAAADIFVLASRYEGYGMVFAEAMARGLPIVASGEGAVADTVPDAAGIIVPVDDRGALAGALRRMIADPGFRRHKADGSWAAGRSLPRWADTAVRFARAVKSARGG